MRRKPPQTKRSVSVRVHVRIGRQKMASLCKRQQCMIERRGIRQDLDSWRYKLIQCVGKVVVDSSVNQCTCSRLLNVHICLFIIWSELLGIKLACELAN